MAEKEPAPALPAATILLLRDAPAGLEVFMVARHHQIDFASGALVFPGGKADPEDFDPRLAGFVAGAAPNPTARGIMVAAIREAYEEAGVLLARPRGEANLIGRERLAAMETDRDALNAGTLGFIALLDREDLMLACDVLTHYAHWVTPEMMPKRFDTHFYLAQAPADHVAIHDGQESVDSVWITPAQAMADARAGRRTVIFPTLRNIAKLARYESVSDAIEGTAHERVVTVLPWTETRADGSYICIPEDAGYDVSEEKIPGRS